MRSNPSFRAVKTGISVRHVNGDLVGTLQFKDGIFSFRYAPTCPEEHRIRGLLEYTGRMFHPFFATRLPSTGRPEVLAELERQNIDHGDIIQVLGSVGAQSPVSPYLFEIRKAA